MKKLLTVLLSLLMLITLSACGKKEDKDQLATIKERGKLIIATEQEWAPFTYVNEAGELVGFDVELANLIAKELGVEIEHQQASFNDILTGVDAGRFDLAINGVTYTEERAQSYNMSTPYIYDKAVLIVAENNSDVKSFDDIKGKIGTNSPNSIYAEKLIEYGALGDDKFVWCDTFEQTMDMLKQGRADVSINAITTLKYYTDTMGADAGVKHVAMYPEGGDQYVVCAMGGTKSEKSNTLIEEVNKILDAARKDGRLAELSKKYFGEDLTVAE